MSLKIVDNLPWESLIFGSFSHSEIALAVNDIEWQTLRASLLCQPQRVKFERLVAYINELRAVDEKGLILHTQKEWERRIHLREVRVTNYVNALKRGGLVQ